MVVGIGTVVGGRFRVERALGEGGMGAVFVAVQEPLGRRVALKVLRQPSGQAMQPETLLRFHNEARAVAALACPHVVAIYDYGEHDGAPYIAMELIDGDTLRQRMQRGRAPVDQIVSWARDIACGLRMAHESGIVHRDLKPENVMIVPDRDRGSVAKLLDFGIAKRRFDDKNDATASLTPGGAVFGTPGYIAPEVAVGGDGDDPRGDVYAFGVVLYEMLCNAPPYGGSTAIATMMAHVHEPVPDPCAARGDVPHPIGSLCMRALAKDPKLRPQNGAALVEELDRARASSLPTESLQAVTPEALAVALGAGSGVVTRTPTPNRLTPIGTTPVVDRPSIAIQPFIPIGGNADDDTLFAEGISEDILTALSCFKQLFVIAQSTMWQKGGRETDALRVGRTLGVRYVVGGCVRRAGQRVRINASLIDVATGGQLWGERYDRALDDLFAIQDDVTQAIVACVAGHIEKDQAEVAKKKAPHAMAAWDWLAKGRAFHHRRTPEDNARAQEALEKAVTIDPTYAQAHAWKACVLGQKFHAFGGGDAEWADAIKATATALELDDTDAECHRLACELAMFANELDKAEHHHDRAIRLNPNDARIVAQRGELSLLRGDFDTAVEALERAVRLDPLSPNSYMRHLACVRYLERRLPEATTLARRLADERLEMLALSAAIAALRGDADAETLAARVRERRPGWTIKAWKRSFATPALVEKWREGFVKAGLG